ncbi:hypothetical protein NL676_039196 [Syzygium grande]|nr:hypothetical protein NL676_039196 [Syzygium grande]
MESAQIQGKVGLTDGNSAKESMVKICWMARGGLGIANGSEVSRLKAAQGVAAGAEAPGWTLLELSDDRAGLKDRRNCCGIFGPRKNVSWTAAAAVKETGAGRRQARLGME